MEIPEYKVQKRDILYLTAKAMSPEGKIEDYLGTTSGSAAYQLGGEGSGGYLLGYDVDPEGNINIPVIGKIKVEGLTVEAYTALHPFPHTD